jgi:hypothetical protein
MALSWITTTCFRMGPPSDPLLEHHLVTHPHPAYLGQTPESISRGDHGTPISDPAIERGAIKGSMAWRDGTWLAGPEGCLAADPSGVLAMA